MQHITSPVNQPYWYLCTEPLTPLRHDLKVDLVIVGGGMAGLTAAQQALKQGLTVALVEKAFVGSGASGKSSGFITPDAEFSFGDLVKMRGPHDAQRIWHFIRSGVDHIRETINEYAIECQYQEQDTLMAASSKRAIKKLQAEHETRRAYHLESHFYPDNTALASRLKSPGYFAGLSYGNTFSIKAFDYCQTLKKILLSQGAHIFEESPVTSLLPDGIATAQAKINASYTIVAVDHWLPDLAPFSYDCYQVQTFLMASAPVLNDQLHQLFPGKAAMAWDTDLIYHYFRFTQDNRLLLGGNDLFSTYTSHESKPSKRIINHLSRYAATYFPHLPLQWEYIWPGLIGITKDLLPLAGKDKDYPNRYYIAGAAGLPWAAALGNYAVTSLLHNTSEFDPFFNPYRRFLIPHALQTVLGKKLTFALCNFQKVGSL